MLFRSAFTSSLYLIKKVLLGVLQQVLVIFDLPNHCNINFADFIDCEESTDPSCEKNSKDQDFKTKRKGLRMRAESGSFGFGLPIYVESLR